MEDGDRHVAGRLSGGIVLVVAAFDSPLHVASDRGDGSRDHPRRYLADLGHYAAADQGIASLALHERRRNSPASPAPLKERSHFLLNEVPSEWRGPPRGLSGTVNRSLLVRATGYASAKAR